MKRKVAVDEDVTRRVAEILEESYGDKGYEFIFIPDLTGYGEKDEVWAERFRKFGGEIVLSANKDITRRPHELKAFRDNDLICFFMQPPWSNRKGSFKLSHALLWWDQIHKWLPNCQKKDCWQVPLSWSGELKRLEVPNYGAKSKAKRTG